jgi:hypothetical protein
VSSSASVSTPPSAAPSLDAEAVEGICDALRLVGVRQVPFRGLDRDGLPHVLEALVEHHLQQCRGDALVPRHGDLAVEVCAEDDGRGGVHHHLTGELLRPALIDEALAPGAVLVEPAASVGDGGGRLPRVGFPPAASASRTV